MLSPSRGTPEGPHTLRVQAGQGRTRQVTNQGPRMQSQSLTHLLSVSMEGRALGWWKQIPPFNKPTLQSPPPIEAPS